MTSRIRRIVRRTEQPAVILHDDARIEPLVVLAQIRVAIDALDERQAFLGQQEHRLLEDARALYEQLLSVAGVLDEVRQQRTAALEQQQELRSAVSLLEGLQAGSIPVAHPDAPRSESLIPQPQGQ